MDRGQTATATDRMARIAAEQLAEDADFTATLRVRGRLSQAETRRSFGLWLTRVCRHYGHCEAVFTQTLVDGIGWRIRAAVTLEESTASPNIEELLQQAAQWWQEACDRPGMVHVEMGRVDLMHDAALIDFERRCPARQLKSVWCSPSRAMGCKRRHCVLHPPRT